MNKLNLESGVIRKKFVLGKSGCGVSGSERLGVFNLPILGEEHGEVTKIAIRFLSLKRPDHVVMSSHRITEFPGVAVSRSVTTTLSGHTNTIHLRIAACNSGPLGGRSKSNLSQRLRLRRTSNNDGRSSIGRGLPFLQTKPESSISSCGFCSPESSSLSLSFSYVELFFSCCVFRPAVVVTSAKQRTARASVLNSFTRAIDVTANIKKKGLAVCWRGNWQGAEIPFDA